MTDDDAALEAASLHDVADRVSDAFPQADVEATTERICRYEQDDYKQQVVTVEANFGSVEEYRRIQGEVREIARANEGDEMVFTRVAQK